MATINRFELSRSLRQFRAIKLPLEGRRPATVCVAVSTHEGDPVIWLTERKSSVRAQSGRLALPGGRIDPEETAAEAALRELREGLGVGAHPDQIIGELDDLTTQSGYVITPFVVWIGRFAGALRPNAAEVAGVRSITMAEVDALPRFVAEPHTDISVPAWSFRGTDIHASTAAILYQFREVTLHQRNTRVAHYGRTLLAPQ